MFILQTRMQVEENSKIYIKFLVDNTKNHNPYAIKNLSLILVLQRFTSLIKWMITNSFYSSNWDMFTWNVWKFRLCTRLLFKMFMLLKRIALATVLLKSIFFMNIVITHVSFFRQERNSIKLNISRNSSLNYIKEDILYKNK